MSKIYKFYLDKAEELSTETVGKIIRAFNIQVLPELKFRRGYYDGNGQEIMKRVQPDATRPNNKIVKNYCATIVDNFQGYLTGNPITYTAIDENDTKALQQILNNNDVINADAEFLRTALIYGIAYEMAYVNEKNETKFKNVNPESIIPIYSDDLDEELLYIISFSANASWRDSSETYRVNVYSAHEVFTYEAPNDFNSFSLLDVENHYFNQVPFAVFNLNSDNTSIFERVISLQDAYNTLLSDEVNDFEAFVDAYMVLKNLEADADDLAQMKANRTILIDGDSDVSYLTKNISDTQIENMLSNINSSIHTISNSPDFSSEEFNQGVSSGIALQFKLVGFNNIASNIQAQFTKSLNSRIDLINQILGLIDTDTFEVKIVFTHNLPSSLGEVVDMVNKLRGLVSDETLLAQIPFIDDVLAELEKIEAQDNKAMDSYVMPNFHEVADTYEEE